MKLEVTQNKEGERALPTAPREHLESKIRRSSGVQGAALGTEAGGAQHRADRGMGSPKLYSGASRPTLTHSFSPQEWCPWC